MIIHIFASMLKDLEYLGFAMHSPGDGVVIYVFDVVDDGIQSYGPYQWSERDPKDAPLDLADVIIVTFEDGTMPVPVGEFDDKARAGEAWGNIFTRIKPIGAAFFFDQESGNNVELHKVLEQEGDDFFLDMFDQCMQCYADHVKRGSRKMTKMERLFDKNVPYFADFFDDEDVHDMYRNFILEMVEEAQNTVDAPLVKFILEQNEELAKKGIAHEKRAAAIVKAVKKRNGDRNKKG